jgi:hypothetical protein
MLGDGIRLLDTPGINPLRWERIVEADTGAVLDLRHRPIRQAHACVRFIP